MHTDVQPPLKIFNLPQHLVVPLFQRPYVWDEEEQWQPLWDDVRRISELRLADPYSTAQHFLGAVVIQGLEKVHGSVDAANIIDGQQRLTTLQLLADAARAVFLEIGETKLADQMEALTHNDERYVSSEDDRLKIRHTNRDRDAFDEVMRAQSPVAYDTLRFSQSKIARAHKFFWLAISDWLDDADPEVTPRRADTLAQVLANGLNLVVIDLLPNENSQEIFETLNARGTPLTAADLIKNLVFQRLHAEGADTQKAYAEVWPFEHKFWETPVRAGALSMSRSSLFFNQWLVSRTGEDVGPKQTFSRFKSYVEHESNRKMADLLATIRQQADQYEAWVVTAEDPDRDLSVVELAVYRMRAANLELLHPVLLWLHSPERKVPQQTVNSVVRTLESWILRRALLRLPTTSAGRTVADLLRALRSTSDEELAQHVGQFLANLNVRGTYWPGDREVKASLLAEAAYQRYPRAILRMVLEAVEDRLRAPHNTARVPRRGYPIEHLMPQQWRTHWPVAPEAEMDRAAHVHRLGNLTLLTNSLNSTVSNGPWLGEKGKRARLHKYDVLLMNRQILDMSEDGWNERQIDTRTELMADALLEIWPVPEGHQGTIQDSRAQKNAWVQLKDLIAAGLLEPGTRVTASSTVGSKTATVSDDGALDLDGVRYHSPSRAGQDVTGRPVNGWMLWKLDDGRRLGDIRAVYKGVDTGSPTRDLRAWNPETDTHDAAKFWRALPLNAKHVLRLIMERSPELTSTIEVAEHLAISGAALGGVLQHLTRHASRLGHSWPMHNTTATPTEYWMDDAMLATLRQAIERTETSESKSEAGNQTGIATDGSPVNVWGIHNDELTYDLIDESFISIGWDPLGNLTSLGDREHVKAALSEAYPDAKDGAIPIWAGVLLRLRDDMQIGDIVVAPFRPDSTVNIGVITSDYYFEPDAPAHRHRRRVDWLQLGLPRDKFSRDALNELGSAMTTFAIKRHAKEFLGAIRPDVNVT